MTTLATSKCSFTKFVVIELTSIELLLFILFSNVFENKTLDINNVEANKNSLFAYICLIIWNYNCRTNATNLQKIMLITLSYN